MSQSAQAPQQNQLMPTSQSYNPYGSGAMPNYAQPSMGYPGTQNMNYQPGPSTSGYAPQGLTVNNGMAPMLPQGMGGSTGSAGKPQGGAGVQPQPGPSGSLGQLPNPTGASIYSGSQNQNPLMQGYGNPQTQGNPLARTQTPQAYDFGPQPPAGPNSPGQNYQLSPATLAFLGPYAGQSQNGMPLDTRGQPINWAGYGPNDPFTSR